MSAISSSDGHPAAVLANELAAAIERFGHGLVQPLAYPLDPSRRLFWLFLLSSAALVALAVWQRERQLTWPALRRTLFSRRYWCHRSTLVDLSCLFGNSALRAAVIVPLLGSHLLATMWVAHTLQRQLGDAPAWAWPWWLVAASYTLSFFVLEDLSRYLLHRCMHRVPLLWRWHRLHHSASVLTPLTLHRVHPLEMALYAARGMLVFGGVSGVFVYQFGRQLSGFDILGVDLLGFLFNLLGANLRHSPIYLGFGALERWFISPAQHQIHHSSAPEHRDRNFGTCLALWDRLGGSWLTAAPRQRLRFGLSTI